MAESRLPTPDISILPQSLQQAVQDDLDADEMLIWLEQPDRLGSACGVYGFNLVIMILGVGLEFGCYALCQKLFVSQAWLQSERSIVSRAMLFLPMLFLMLIGLYMMLYPILGWIRAMKQASLVTDQRVVSIHRGKREFLIEQITYDQLQQLRVDRGENGSKGDLIIRGMNHGRRRRQLEIAFLNISHPHAVERLIRENMA